MANEAAGFPAVLTSGAIDSEAAPEFAERVECARLAGALRERERSQADAKAALTRTQSKR